MIAEDLPLPKSLPIPDNFPITWDNPEDAKLYWSFDRMHWPTPITPMTGQYLEYIFADGFNRALQACELPISAYTRRINTYHYDSAAPLPLSAEEMVARSQRGEANLSAAIESLDEDWANRYLPEVKKHLAFWEVFDLEAASLQTLLTHLDETIARIQRVYEIHFLVYFPFVLAPSLFEELYGDLFDDEHTLEAYRLLQGIDNKTLEADRALWQLSRSALSTPAVGQILQQTPASEVVAVLEASTGSEDFLANLRIYLDDYGRRSDKSTELDTPSWIEEPTPVIQRLQEYMTQPDRDLAGELAVQAVERERLMAETRLRLAEYPLPVIDQFETLLKAAHTGLFVGEEHSYWIDQRATYQVRRVMLEVGRRCAATGVLDRVEDIFYLTFDEAHATLEVLPRLDRRRVVAGRRAEMEYFRTVQPPPAIGELPPGPPPEDPLSRAINRFFGFGAPRRQPNDPNALYGNPGSPGMRRGQAKVVHSLAESGKLKQGDVLVAETTTPAWTPLFATAAAVVTDTGGVLSHRAVVAREYGIPAVVGVGVATRVIQDGQILEVNGSEGVIRLLTPE